MFLRKKLTVNAFSCLPINIILGLSHYVRNQIASFFGASLFIFPRRRISIFFYWVSLMIPSLVMYEECTYFLFLNSFFISDSS